MFKARCYKKTGFNSTNIPRNTSVLENASEGYIDVDLSVTTPILSAVDLPLSFSDIKRIDYIIIFDPEDMSDIYCYFADASQSVAQATDVFRIPLTPDFLLSAGGVDNISIIDGITVRSTWALNNVNPNKLTSGDPYLAPSETMTLYTEFIGEGDEYHDYIESTINIPATAQKDDAITAVSESADVTYPVPEYAENGRFATYQLNDGSRTFKSPGSMLFTYTGGNVDELIRQGLRKIRGMGLESAILRIARIPTKYASYETLYDNTETTPEQHYVLLMQGKWTKQQTNLNLHIISDEAGGSRPEYEVLNYSEYARYGLMSASGETMEADPKDLMTDENPNVVMVGDPRLDGRPYFRFEKINNEKTDHIEFFRNCISGLPWKSVPLVYTEASGNALNTARYEASRQIADFGYEQAQRNIGLQKEFTRQNYEQGEATQTLSLLSAGIDGALSSAGISLGGGSGGMFSGVQGLTNTAMQYISRDLAYAQQTSSIAYSQLATVENYTANKIADALSYGIQQNVIVPSVMFPYNTETLRDFYGNGVLVYRYWYTDDDIDRILRIIRAYGVKYTMKTVSSHLTPEADRDYNYIEASGVTIADQTQWRANGIALQLAGGVRVWNTKPYSIN